MRHMVHQRHARRANINDDSNHSTHALSQAICTKTLSEHVMPRNVFSSSTVVIRSADSRADSETMAPSNSLYAAHLRRKCDVRNAMYRSRRAEPKLQSEISLHLLCWTQKAQKGIRQIIAVHFLELSVLRLLIGLRQSVGARHQKRVEAEHTFHKRFVLGRALSMEQRAKPRTLKQTVKGVEQMSNHRRILLRLQRVHRADQRQKVRHRRRAVQSHQFWAHRRIFGDHQRHERDTVKLKLHGHSRAPSQSSDGNAVAVAVSVAVAVWEHCQLFEVGARRIAQRHGFRVRMQFAADIEQRQRAQRALQLQITRIRILCGHCETVREVRKRKRNAAALGEANTEFAVATQKNVETAQQTLRVAVRRTLFQETHGERQHSERQCFAWRMAENLE